MFDVERFKVEIGGDNGGDVDNGVPGSSGEALLLLEIGELVDQYLEEFSPEQAGMIDVTFFRFLFLALYLIFFCLLYLLGRMGSLPSIFRNHMSIEFKYRELNIRK